MPVPLRGRRVPLVRPAPVGRGAPGRGEATLTAPFAGFQVVDALAGLPDQSSPIAARHRQGQ